MEKKVNKDLANKIQELQLIEQSLQNILLQMQNLQFEQNEYSEALDGLEEAKGDVFKVVSQIMIKAKKEDLKKELEEKNEVTDLKIKNFERQEKTVKEKLAKLRDEVMSELK